MYNTPVPLPPKKCVSVFMFFDVIAKSESNVKSMPKVVHAKLTTIKGRNYQAEELESSQEAGTQA